MSLLRIIISIIDKVLLNSPEYILPSHFQAHHLLVILERIDFLNLPIQKCSIS
jgi:hypothetical protein